MNTLRLNIINLHAPYRVWQKFKLGPGPEFKSAPSGDGRDSPNLI